MAYIIASGLGLGLTGLGLYKKAVHHTRTSSLDRANSAISSAGEDSEEAFNFFTTEDSRKYGVEVLIKDMGNVFSELASEDELKIAVKSLMKTIGAELVAEDWQVQEPIHSDQGVGDLLFQFHSQHILVEVKQLTRSSGKAAQAKRDEGYQEVVQRVDDHAHTWQSGHPGEVVWKMVCTNVHGLQFRD